MTIELRFASGTLEVRGAPREQEFPLCLWDPRSGCHRAPAFAYAEVVRHLHGAKIEYKDDARRYEELAAPAKIHREPRFYQREGLDAWRKAKCRGVVVLPTGAGKTHVAAMAIEDRR